MGSALIKVAQVAGVRTLPTTGSNIDQYVGLTFVILTLGLGFIGLVWWRRRRASKNAGHRKEALEPTEAART